MTNDFRAEIIAIGTELTTGAKLDTNSQWLSIELSAIGVPVLAHTTIADDLTAIVAALQMALSRAEIVIITGGLGPTLDDLTREALARLAGVELVLHEASLRHITEMFAKRKRLMPERNKIQALFPAGSEPIDNPHGTAPGIWMELPNSPKAWLMSPTSEVGARRGERVCLIAAMPGVPSEMKPMFRDRILPRLPRATQVIRRARVNCFGVGESACEEMLGDLTARGRDPEVGITVHEGTITLRIEAHGESEIACDAKNAATKTLIRERLGGLVFGDEDEQLEDVVVRELLLRRQTVAIADEVTGGTLSAWLTAVPDGSRAFVGGLVGASPAALDKLLLETSTSELPAPFDGTSSQAIWLAESARKHFSADFALSIAGSLSPNRADADEIPRLFIALAHATGSQVEEHIPVADISFARHRAAKTALNLLRLWLG